MTGLQVLDADAAARVRAVCEAIVPGCASTGAEVYVDAQLARMDEATREVALAAFATLAGPVAAGPAELATHVPTPEFGLVRALACEAYYSDFVAAGAPGPGAWAEIGFAPPLATRLVKDWSYLGIEGTA
jgi:hypothetical protein